MKIKYAQVGLVTGAIGGAWFMMPLPVEAMVSLVAGGLIGLGLGQSIDNISAFRRSLFGSEVHRNWRGAGSDEDPDEHRDEHRDEEDFMPSMPKLVLDKFGMYFGLDPDKFS